MVNGVAGREGMRQVLQIGQLAKIAAIVIAAVLLVACGSEDAEETPTPTTAAVDAQPTVQTDATSEMSLASPPASNGTEVPANTDMSTIAMQESPAATASSATPTVGTQTVAGTPTSVPATPVAATGEATAPSGASTPIAGAEGMPAAPPVGDGTTGAVTAATPAATPATPGASPVASPAAQATPGTPLSVTGCEVPNVPPYTGEVTRFSLTTDVNFRTGPSADCPLALDQPIGAFQVVEVIGGPVLQQDDGSEWVQIRVLDTEGWVAFEFLEPVEP